MSNRVTNVGIGRDRYLHPLIKILLSLGRFSRKYNHLIKFFEQNLFRIVCKSDGNVENVEKIINAVK